jgi:quinol monooxygenase YgiN
MFIISGVMRFDPERREEVAEAMRTAVQASRHDDGCLSYSFCEEVDEPGAFRIFEHWSSEETFGAHCQTPHYLAFMEVVGRVGMRGADVNRYEVGSYQSLTGG